MNEIQALEAIGKGLASESLLLCQQDHLVLIKAFGIIKKAIDERNTKLVAEKTEENGN